MAMIENQKDMVISYVVRPAEGDEGLPDRLAEFLKAGYRVIDVISTPSSSASYFCITAVLTFLDPTQEGRQIYYHAGK
jgi:hypothetical protein